MAWVYLAIAGLFEIVWATGLKSTHGFTKPVPSVLTVLAMIASFYFLSQALKVIPIGTGYAVWTGIGALGTAIVGIVMLGEQATPARLACLAMVVAGIAGLKLTSGH